MRVVPDLLAYFGYEFAKVLRGGDPPAVVPPVKAARVGILARGRGSGANGHWGRSLIGVGDYR